MTRLIFVGSFREKAADGSVGGTMAACRGLMRSPFAEAFEVYPIDSTTRSVPPPGVVTRSVGAVRRLLRFVWLLLRVRPRAALIFATAGGSFYEKGLMVLLCRLAGVRSVLSPRSFAVVPFLTANRLNRRFGGLVLRSADRLMAQSERIREALAPFEVPAERFAVVRNWVDPGPAPELQTPAAGELRILYMGWLRPIKGIDVLVQAIIDHAVAWRERGVRFVICGRGSEEQRVRRVVSERSVDDLVEFRGWVAGADKEQALASADVVVLPSFSEGMPNTLLEAMARGRACVASAVGGVPELIVSPEVGSLVPAGDAEALARAMLELVDDDERRARVGAAARRHIEQEHDVDKVWPKVAALLDERAAGGVEAACSR